MSTKLKLYYVDASPAVRGTLLTIAALGLEVELIYVNLLEREHLKPEFLKKNPCHTLPTLEDGDFVIWDSHAINAYLVQKYGKFGYGNFYPQDIDKRAIIDQRNFFDAGVLFPRLIAVTTPILYKSAKKVDKDGADKIVDGYSQLEALLEGNNYVAGKELSIADFSIVATVTSSNALVPIADNRFPNISRWIAKMQKQPYYAEANQAGLDKFTKLVKSKLN